MKPVSVRNGIPKDLVCDYVTFASCEIRSFATAWGIELTPSLKPSKHSATHATDPESVNRAISPAPRPTHTRSGRVIRPPEGGPTVKVVLVLACDTENSSNV